MGLARALVKLPADRESEALVRDVIVAFKSREGQWLAREQVAEAVAVSVLRLTRTLDVLAEHFVLETDPSSGFRYVPDSILRREVEAFLRRAESHSGMLQANVAKFRQRYTSR
jgi:hypothetical protein